MLAVITRTANKPRMSSGTNLTFNRKPAELETAKPIFPHRQFGIAVEGEPGQDRQRRENPERHPHAAAVGCR